MKAAVPYLLFRNLSDPSDRPDEKGSGESGKISQDPHKVHSNDVSFCRISTGEGGAPMSLSPKSLRVNVKERKKTSPRSIDSSDFRVWGRDGKGMKEGGVDDTDRVLSLREWTDASGVDGDRWNGEAKCIDGDLDSVNFCVFVLVMEELYFGAGEKVEKGSFGHGGAGSSSSSAVGVSQG